MSNRRVYGPFRSIVIYASVALFAMALLIFDTWPLPPESPIEWLFLLLLVIPMVLTGEWLSGGVLRNALTALTSQADGQSRAGWWRVFYYCVMCMLFATATVAIYEGVRGD
jgi:hypothetical protein